MTTHTAQRGRAKPAQLAPEPPLPEPDDPERLAYLAGLKHQIRAGVYRPDIRDLARSLASMLVRDL